MSWTRRAVCSRLALAVPVAAAISLEAAVEGIKALTFDVFGTVVDWRSTIVREGRELGRRKGLDLDWARFADDWRAGYGPAMNRVRQGELPWTKIDDLHRMILDQLLEQYGIDLSDEDKAEFNRVWHRLEPWPDAVEGLSRLKKRYVIATLSNGNVGLLVNMAKHSGLPWDVVLSSELAMRYKPDLEVYRKATELLGLETRQVLMVAAHKGDLRAAAKAGMRTGYVPRPLEHGPGDDRDYAPDPDFDVVADDFEDLATKLGA